MSPTKRDAAGDMGHLHVIKDGWHILHDSPFRSTIGLPTHGAYTTSAWTMMQAFAAAAVPQWLTLPNWPASLPVQGFLQWPLINGQTTESIVRLLRTDIFAGTAWVPGATSAIVPTMRLTTRGDVVHTLKKKQPGGIVGVSEIELCPYGDMIPAAVELWSTNAQVWRGEQETIYPFQLVAAPDTYYPVTAPPGGYQNAALFDPGGTLATAKNGAAQAIMAALGQVIWKGSFTYEDEGCYSGLRPGDTVNFVDPSWDPQWAACRAVIQSVKEDPLTGRTTCTVGISGGRTPKSVFEGLCNWVGARRWIAERTYRAFQAPWLTSGAFPIAIPLAGAGTSATVILTGLGDSGPTGPGITGTIILTTGFSGLSGPDLTRIAYNIPNGIANGASPVLTAANAATIALAGGTSDASSMISAFDDFGFTISTTGGLPASQGTVLQWTFVLTPLP